MALSSKEKHRRYYERHRKDVIKRTRKYQRKHSEKRAEWNRQQQRKIRLQRKNHLIQLKSVPCKDCKKRYKHWIMEFDHTRGVKLHKISPWLSDRLLAAELKKCDVVCANCHNNRTYRRRMKNG